MAVNKRSIEERYAEWTLKEYEHWTLLLNENQRYLGRAYVWLARKGEMQRLSDTTLEESIELWRIMSAYECALKDWSWPNHMNYCWLGNFFHEHGGHGHMHLIPRYKGVRYVGNCAFTDGRWGQNYAPSEPFNPPHDILVRIRDELRRLLSL